MKFVTQLVFGLDIKNSIGLYANENALMDIVVNKYERRCIQGLYVEKIMRIVTSSNCMINKFGAPFGQISVVCEVLAVKYARGEIINGCVIENKDKSGLVACRAGHVSILLSSSRIFESMVRGQIMSVRVNRARYTPNMETVVINAIPYLPSREFTAYKIGGNADPIDEAIFADVRARIAEEETAATTLKETHASAYNLFERMLFPYPAQITPSDNALNGATEMPLMEFVVDAIAGKAATGYVSRDPAMNLSRSFVFRYKAAPESAKVRDDIVFEAVIIELLEDYCAHLRTIREYIEIYSEDQVRSHVNLWAIYMKNKNHAVGA